MCKGKARLAGIIKGRQAARLSLSGAQGLMLVEYTGEKQGETEEFLHSKMRYPYHPGRKFYVDANDATRLLAWRENGTHVFEQVQR